MEATINPQAVYGISAAARILGRSRSTIKHWCDRDENRLPTERDTMNGRVRIRGIYLQRILKNLPLYD